VHLYAKHTAIMLKVNISAALEHSGKRRRKM